MTSDLFTPPAATPAIAVDRFHPDHPDHEDFSLDERQIDRHPGWPFPKSIGAASSAAPPFDADLLPGRLRPWVEDVAERMQVPPDFVAVSAMVGLAGAVGRSVGIRPKRLDDWLVVPNLWAVCLGPPGSKKSPAISEGVSPLVALEAASRREHVAAAEDHDGRAAVFEVLKAEMRREMREAARSDDGRTPEAVLEAYAEHDPGPPPVCRRLVVHDATTEMVQELLAQNPRGLTLFRDEILGFVASMDKPGREDARKFYLEAWNGTGGFSTDRIGRGSLYVPKVCLSIVGGAQPDAWRSYVDEALQGGAGADGFLQRFQLAVWPDRPAGYEHVDRAPDAQAKADALALVSWLDRLDPSEVGASPDDDDGRGVPYLRFAPDAQGLFDGWLVSLEEHLLRGDERPAFEAHLSKYRSLMPSLALLVHLGETGRGPVPLDAAERAVAWCRYLTGHARRIYGGVRDADGRKAVRLARRIVGGDLGERFTSRDVYRKKWAGLSDKASAESAVGALLDADWLAIEDVETGGRPKTEFVVSPYVLDLGARLLPE